MKLIILCKISMHPSTWFHLSLLLFLSVVGMKALDSHYSVLQITQTGVRQITKGMTC